MQVSYNTGTLWHHGREPSWSEMEYQLRNWLYFTWLSGDFNVEQHVHSLDKAAWAMNDEPPVKATGLGGRQVRTGEEWGNIYDHFAVDLRIRQRHEAVCQLPPDGRLLGRRLRSLVGTKGRAEMMQAVIEGDQPWRYRGEKPNMYEEEHREMFAAIRSANPINNGHYMAKSTMMAIMGRMAAYTGQTLTWDQCLNSTEDLTPAKYEWADVSIPGVAMPGLTRFA